jgi:hypothetical protein
MSCHVTSCHAMSNDMIMSKEAPEILRRWREARMSSTGCVMVVYDASILVHEGCSGTAIVRFNRP